MTYKNEELPQYMRTAGKITVLTAIVGFFVFIMAFVIDVGTQELQRVSAQSATTSLTVLNTPPTFTLNPYEVIGSSTSTPTNSGDVLQWSAIGSDANGADYYLLVCSTNASPTPVANDAPVCGGGVQWGVSSAASSSDPATVSTTTVEWGTGQFAEQNTWFAWVCDADPVDPRCVVVPEQGDYSTSSSPFNINNRPVLTDFANDGPADPGATIVFYSSSTDPDTLDVEDELLLVVCGTNTDYNTTTNTCDANFIASTTISVLSDASATYTLPAIIRDQAYGAYGYIVDIHGHEASANPIQANFTVNNVAPVVSGGDIVIYGNAGPGTDLVVDVPGGETPSSTLNFTITDANSCLTAASSSEITSYVVSIFRSSYGTSTALNPDACDGGAASYDPNYCYPSGVGQPTWNLSCTATTTCQSPLQDDIDYSCTFPLWFLADPTDNVATTPDLFAVDNWSAAVAGIDDDAVTGVFATTSNAKELISFNSLDILTAEIAYGGVEPGSDTGTLSATSTLLNVGNTGLDQDTQGESMCGTYTVSTECPVSATSTIPESEQQFSSTSLAYGSPLAITLSSSTYQEVELDVNKTTSTSSASWQSGQTYWGIAVPIAITLAGNYTGLNSFIAITAEKEDW